MEASAGPREGCSDRMFDPMTRRMVKINPSFRNAKRKVEFNAVRFLSEQKTHQTYEPLQFPSDDDIQDQLAVIDALPDQKRLHLLADNVLRKIAEYSEIFNKVFNYRVLDVNYERD